MKLKVSYTWYMTKNDQKALQQLEEMERDLSHRLERLSADLSQSHSADSAEQAVERENDEVVEQLRDDSALELSQVKQAIRRIHDGTYHQCKTCGEDISTARLTALPYTVYCIACADT